MESAESPPSTQSKLPSEIVSLWPLPPGGSLVPAKVAEDRIVDDSWHRKIITDIITPNLHVYLPEHPDPNRPACVICPGGGYWILAIEHEGDEVARMFNRNGVAAFVLEYRLPDGNPVPEGTLPPPIADAQRAMRLVRANAGKWNIDPNRIGIMGFSAGGHVAATATTHFDYGKPTDPDPIQRQSSRPDFSFPIYAVISLQDPVAHTGSRERLLGKEASAELLKHYSADQNVTKQTPPMFLVHAEDDGAIPVRNSLRMKDAADKAAVPCEVVILKTGGHGFGLGVNGGEPTIWPGKCMDWMRKQGFLTSE